jgi:cytidyltransferase-like protein
VKRVVVSGGFDDLRSRHVRFLHEASKLGDVQVLLWSDETINALEERAPKFPQAERLYLLQAIRYVSRVTAVTARVERETLPLLDAIRPELWVVDETADTGQKRAFAQAQGLEYRVLRARDLQGFPVEPAHGDDSQSPRKKVVVTGCFDWFHSGHVRFFEEVSQLGDLYVVVGHDQNVRLLKGPGHPLFPQDERRYMVQAVRYVRQALISTGHGWMDAEPEIARIKPDVYVVNEEGDKPEKREFCEAHGLEYVVLKRTPKEGLPRRQSTDLRGF